MKFTRQFSVKGQAAYNQVKWKTVEAKIEGKDDFYMPKVEVPATWSQDATNILASKYFRKAGVPTSTEIDQKSDFTGPDWLAPHRPAHYNEVFGSETSAHQVFHRMVGCWTYWGWRADYFDDEESAKIFYHEVYLMLARQMGAPNSPQWFNTGLHWAYGIEGPASGQWAFDSKTGEIFETQNSYERPQPHACFIQSVEDSLVGPRGIFDLIQKEARLFKYGSGTGTNFSTLRGKGEELTGGGASSGLMSFLRVLDSGAGAIQSGGTTRRAAKMVIVDADHPEIEDFINWKVREEAKAAAMYVGSIYMKDPGNSRWADAIDVIPSPIIDRQEQGMNVDELKIDSMEASAIKTVDGQNSNNSIRVTDDFMQAVEKDGYWSLRERTTNKETKALKARDLWNQICRAAWASGDPGLQFHNTINRWHTCKADGEIRASNPCSEYMFLDDTACNLASVNLCAFLRNKPDSPLRVFSVEDFTHAVRIWTVVLDISIEMASFPSREIAEGTYKYRTLGLGYSNLGGLLMRLGIPYDSNQGRDLAQVLTALMTGISYKTSADLGDDLGGFPQWMSNTTSMNGVLNLHYKSIDSGKYEPDKLSFKVMTTVSKIWDEVVTRKCFRNAQTTLIAPTGTISFVMDCDTTGLEPEFALKKTKALIGGGYIETLNQAVEEALVSLGYDNRDRITIQEYIKTHGTVEGCSTVKQEHLPVFDCANAPEGFSRAIRPMAHVEMLAAIQPFLSGAASKTINLPNSATIQDVDEIYWACYRLGIKAVALFRDGCKLSQPYSTKKANRVVPIEAYRAPQSPYAPQAPQTDQPNLSRGIREYLPWRREGYTQKVKIGEDGQSIFATFNHYPDGRMGEVYLEIGHEGSTLRAMADLWAMSVSIGLQYGTPVQEYVDRFLHVKFEPAGSVEGHNSIKFVSSIADFVAREMALEFLGRTDLAQTNEAPVELKSVGAAVVEPTIHRRSLDICPECHQPSLVRTGTCRSCKNCPYNEGCS